MKVEWVHIVGNQSNGISYILELLSVPSNEDSSAADLLLHIYTVSPPSSHHSLKKRKQAQEGEQPAEQKISWKASHVIRTNYSESPTVASCAFDLNLLTFFVLCTVVCNMIHHPY